MSKKITNPKYDKFLTKEQALYISRAISDGYHRRDDYPPFKLVSFEDRPVFQRYVDRVLADMVKS